MLCKYKEQFEYVIASQETADYILDRIGFGKEKCEQTHKNDERYGFADENEIKYGFEKGMRGTIPYGRYVVFGCNLTEWAGGYEVFTESQFNELFEKCG